MGRRSVNTTKGGRFMNPTDRARKEARRKELKKNKKQRDAVRYAVLKSKDAYILLEEAARLDDQEYDTDVPPLLNVRVLQEKRKKILDSFDRLMGLYKKEEPDKVADLQRKRQQYESRRTSMALKYEQVKAAQKVEPSKIPLPDHTGFQKTTEIPLPAERMTEHIPSAGLLDAAAMATSLLTQGPTKSILKRTETPVPPGPPKGLPDLGRDPVGPPVGAPPQLSESEPDASDDDTVKKKAPGRHIRFFEDLNNSSDDEETKNKTPPTIKYNDGSSLPSALPPLPPGTSRFPQAGGGIPSLPAGMMSFFPGYNIPLPSVRPPLPLAGTVFAAPPSLHPTAMPAALDHSSSKVTFADQLSTSGEQATPSDATIEAKPKLKFDLNADLTRLVPTAVKVRRVTRDAMGRIVTPSIRKPTASHAAPSHDTEVAESNVQSKDSAYDEFMKEISV